MSLIFKHIDTDIQLENIRDDWTLLDEQTQHHNICSSYDWVYNWWNVFKNVDNNKLGFNKQLFIICGYDANKLVFVFPLMKIYRKKIGVSISFVEFIGQQWSGIYFDVIVDIKYNNHGSYTWRKQ